MGLPAPRHPSPRRERRVAVSFLKRLFGGGSEPQKPRVRVCVECGMPVAEHKQWCSILKGQQEMSRRTAEPAVES